MSPNLSESSNPRHKFDFTAAFILIFALMTAAYQLVVTRWVDGLFIMLTLALFGGVLGLVLGYSQFAQKWGIVFATLYGMLIIPWQLALTLGRGTPFLTRLETLWVSLFTAISQLKNLESVRSPHLFLLLMAVLFWGLSTQAGFTLVRKPRPWLTVLPVGLLSLIIYVYASATSLSAGYLATYIFLALILVARIFINIQQSRWLQTQTQVPGLMMFDLMRVTLMITLVLVFFSWLFPIGLAKLPSVEEAWKKASRSMEGLNVRLEKAFAAIKPSAKLVSGYYDEFMDLGRGNSRSEDLFLIVEAPARPSKGVRYYWRARSFDVYENGGWRNSPLESVFFPLDTFEVDLPDYTGRWDGTFEIETQSLISTLYLPGETYWVSRPAQITYASNPDGSLDIAAVHADPQLRADTTYEVRARLGNFTLEELRQAGTDYPIWVTERYLQLPETITPRTLELARFITDGQENPHDQAAAITLWLRDNIEYSFTVPHPPADQDLVDWLLFDLQRGFCNYYASAEVILLRAVGIPARMSVGFAQGERLTELTDGILPPKKGREKYRVLEKSAHSWPEVYFPGFGWVEFEPTVIQEPLIRPLNREPGRVSPNLDQDSLAADPAFEDELAKRELLLEQEYLRLQDEANLSDSMGNSGFHFPWPVVILIFGVAGLILGWRARLRWNLPPVAVLVETGIIRIGWSPPRLIRRWAIQASLPPLERAFHEVNLALRRIGHPPNSSDTPQERALKLAQLLPDVEIPLQKLVQEYQATIYSPKPGSWLQVLPTRRLIQKQSFLGWLRRLVPQLKRK